MSERLITHQLEFRRWLMACQFEVILNAGIPLTGPSFALESLDIVERLEELLSVYKPESDFTRINQSPVGLAVAVDQHTIDLIQLSIELHRETTGAFNMWSASLGDLWGFSRREGRMPKQSEIDDILQALESNTIEVDSDARTVTRTHDQIKLNSGGIGKGYALDCMAKHLQASGVNDFFVHGGHSSILAAGNRFDIDQQDGWRVAVRHPEQQQYLLGELCLRSIALGTSGPANQFFYFDGVRYGHIIDPRTGWPATGMLSITVLHPSAAMADALATGLYVLGIEQAEKYVAKHPETSFIAMLPSKKQGEVEIVTCNLADHVWRRID
jgi:FAD:protein FMN transferase